MLRSESQLHWQVKLQVEGATGVMCKVTGTDSASASLSVPVALPA